MQHAAQQDLDTIVEIDTAEVQILHPLTKQPTGNTITIAGPEHPKRKAILFARQRKLRSQMVKKGRIDFTDPEEEEGEAAAYLADCTLGWKLRMNGTDVPFSKQAAADLYNDPKRAWLRAQVSAALDDRENFIRTCEASASPTPSSNSASANASPTVQA